MSSVTTIGPSGVRHGFAILSSVKHSPILLGTSSFTATGWQGSFYPKGLRPTDYLSYYAQHFDTVEVDSTFYATPNVSVVRSWNAKTPEGFLFAAKVLREHGVALTLIDQGWMPRPWEMKDKFDLITSDFTYVRWLGDRKGIEEKTTTWDKVIVDRQGDLCEWVSLLKKIQERRIMILAFANNHYAGFGPGTVDLFRRLWGMEALRAVPRPTGQQPSLFD